MESGAPATRLAGNEHGLGGFADGHGGTALFNGPRFAAMDGRGRLLVADSRNHRVRAVTMEGEVSTLAGTGGQ